MNPFAKRLLAAVLPATALAAGAAAPGEPPRVLRVCADPDNRPLSHRDGTGLENRIASLLARELGARLQTHWAPLEGRIVSATLGARACDVLLGVPAGFPRTATSTPYYRSSFVLVQRKDAPAVASLHDPRLAQMRIGVPRVRHDVTATPPALALHELGAGPQLVGYRLEEGNMAQRLVADVAERRIDVAALWGPQAGWLVHRHRDQVQLAPVAAGARFEHLPMQVSMALAVRREDRALLAELDEALARRRAEIDAILREFHVPLAGGGTAEEPAPPGR